MIGMERGIHSAASVFDGLRNEFRAPILPTVALRAFHELIGLRAVG